MYKKSALYSLLVTLLSSSALATNGTLLIGSGAISRAMGGVGTATFVGTESALKNPAMLMANDGDQFSFSTTAIFESATLSADGGISEDYGKDIPFSPSLGYLHNINKEMVFAVHSAAVGGGAVAVDYGSNSNAAFLKFSAEQAFIDTAFAFAYKKSNLSLGASLIVNYSTFETATSAFGAQTYDPSTALGFQLGMAYEYGLHTFGLTYKSERSVHNKLASGTGIDYYKEIPAELGLGVNYNAGKLNLALDIKDILWSNSGKVGHSSTAFSANSADGYAADGFRDQIVFALGAAYKMNEDLIYRAGFNYGENPITDTGLRSGTANKIHALSEKHFTAGLSYNISKSMAFDAAATYAPENSAYISSATAIDGSTLNNVTYYKEQKSLTVGLTVKF